MNEFDKVILETAKFLRGKYKLDEVAGKYYDNHCIRFRQSGKTILTLLLHDDYLEFLIIFGQAEREKFEQQRFEFSQEILDQYDGERTLHDGKWLMIRVETLEKLHMVEKMILIKKKPNRKPLPNEHLVMGKCGHRCDLCVHYVGNTEEFRATLIPHLTNVYGTTDWSMRCTGCDTEGCQCYQEGYNTCPPLECLKKEKLVSCLQCKKYPCDEATVGYKRLEPKNISGEDVTWAILPYVPNQYE